MFEKKITQDHLDLMGHVNHATYLNILEEARWSLYQQYGYDPASVKKERKGPIILEANVKYRKELMPDEIISVKTNVVQYRSSLGEIEQIIYKENGKIACKAHLTFGHFDLDKRRLLHPEGKWLRIHQDLLKKSTMLH